MEMEENDTSTLKCVNQLKPKEYYWSLQTKTVSIRIGCVSSIKLKKKKKLKKEAVNSISKLEY